MSTLVLPQSMVADRDAGIKANAQHVDDNFDALALAVNGKLDLDGTSTPTADLTMGNHKLTNVATPTLSGDAATKGYVDSADLLKANLASPAFTGAPTAPTPSSSDNSTKIATTAFVIGVLKAMYPVGSIYIGTQNTCPMGSFFGTWTLVGAGRALWTGNGTNGNTTIAAGLPNIKAKAAFSYGTLWSTTFSGAFKSSGNISTRAQGEGGTSPSDIELDASLSSSIYGNSTTVQPPAYVVNVWRRTA